MKICIESKPDGTFAVYEDNAAPAKMMGEAGEMAATPEAEPIATLDEALDEAREMLAGAGKANSPEDMFTNAKPAESMQQGFDKARGNQMY